MITLKEKLEAAMTPAEACVLRAALDALGKMQLEAGVRWRVMQMEHVLLQNPEKSELEEP